MLMEWQHRLDSNLKTIRLDDDDQHNDNTTIACGLAILATLSDLNPDEHEVTIRNLHLKAVQDIWTEARYSRSFERTSELKGLTNTPFMIQVIQFK